MSKSFKRFAIFAALLLFVAVIKNCFMTDDLLKRALVIGMGIDHDGENYQITCEVINGTTAGSQNAADSDQNRLYKGEGKTVPDALQNMQERWGRIPSLGECFVIVFGEEICQNGQIEDCVIFLTRYNTLKDGVFLFSCDGKAEDLLDKQTTSNKSVSIALKQIVQVGDKYTTVPENHLSRFVYSQMNPSKTAFLPHIKAIKDEQKSAKSDEQSDIENVILDVSAITLFQEFRRKEIITDKIRDGFVLIAAKGCYLDFAISDDEQGPLQAQNSSVGLMTKKTKTSVKMTGEGQGAKVNVEISVRFGYTHADINDRLKDLMQKTDESETDSAAEQVSKQIMESATAAVEFAKSKNIDLLGLNNALYAKYGKKWLEEAQKHDKVLEKIDVEISVKASK